MVWIPVEAVPWRAMSRRIDIELTSALDDGTWTWRAAGAKQPKGVLDGSVLPAGAKVGDELKVEVEQQLEGLTVLSVVHGREKHDRDLLELLPSEREFKPVVETRAKRERGERRPRGDRPPRGDRDGERGAGRQRRDGETRQRRDGDGQGVDGQQRRDRRERARRGPSFTPPPEVPQRPKPKRLRPGKANRNAVLNGLPEEQRPIAELALQGMPAVRQRLREENERAVAEGRAVMPEATVLKMAEELLPRLRVAEWRDRAEAAQQQITDLDLRDLRSVVAASGDPMVARDETTRPLVEQLQAALATKQEQELQLWYGDVDAALAVGRVVRALRLSSQPPKAGVPFPPDIAQRLVDSANASLAPMDPPDRWIAMLEAAAFSPVRVQIRPARRPDVVSEELLATVNRLAPALPQVAELFEIEVPDKAPMPKPLRIGPRRKERDVKKAAAKSNRRETTKGSKVTPDAPVDEGTPVAEETTVVDDTPVDEGMPVVEDAPVDDGTPVVEATPDEVAGPADPASDSA